MPDQLLIQTLGGLPARTHEVVIGLRQGLLDIFGPNLAAIWLYGGCLFAPTALDIDLHILLQRELTPAQTDQISLLEHVSENVRWVNELDSWYILLDAALSTEPPRDLRHTDFRDSHWSLHRAHWLAGACIVVHGLAPAEVVVQPSWSELKETLHAEMDDAQAVKAHSAYWTLQLCRVLASLETKDVVRSKLDSGRWALGRLPGETHGIVRQAMRVYAGEAPPEAFWLPEAEYQSFYSLIRPLLDAALEQA